MDSKCVAPIEGEVTFSNTGNFIVARGKFHTTVELTCSRCLKSCTMEVELPIEEELPITALAMEAPVEEEEEELPEDAKEPFFEENIFNLTELLRQNILVAVPIKPLCDENCKGLCSAVRQGLKPRAVRVPSRAGGIGFCRAGLAAGGRTQA